MPKWMYKKIILNVCERGHIYTVKHALSVNLRTHISIKPWFLEIVNSKYTIYIFFL